MLRRFLRWSWLKPLAKRFIAKNGKAVLRELLHKTDLPAVMQQRIEKLTDGLSPADAKLLEEIAEYVEMLETPAGHQVARTIRRIMGFLA